MKRRQDLTLLVPFETCCRALMSAVYVVVDVLDVDSSFMHDLLSSVFMVRTTTSYARFCME